MPRKPNAARAPKKSAPQVKSRRPRPTVEELPATPPTVTSHPTTPEEAATDGPNPERQCCMNCGAVRDDVGWRDQWDAALCDNCLAGLIDALTGGREQRRRMLNMLESFFPVKESQTMAHPVDHPQMAQQHMNAARDPLAHLRTRGMEAGYSAGDGAKTLHEPGRYLIPGRVDAAHRALSELEQELEMLVDTLQPILAPTMPSQPATLGGGGIAIEAPQSQVADMLESLRARTVSIGQRIRDMRLRALL